MISELIAGDPDVKVALLKVGCVTARRQADEGDKKGRVLPARLVGLLEVRIEFAPE